MVTLIAALVCGMDAGPTPPIRLVEAEAAAEWFFRCVDEKGPFRAKSVELLHDGREWGRNTPIYLVVLSSPGKDGNLVAFVDGISGDVVHAYDFPYTTGTYVTSAQTDRWLKRLGRSGGVSVSEGKDHYDAEIGGRHLFNLNGYTRTIFQVKNGGFAYYIGFGTSPSAPNGEPKVSRKQAIEAAQKERKKTVPRWNMPLEARTEMGIFYDDKAGAAKWAWKVEEGTLVNGEFHESFTNYVDAETGRAYGHDDFQNSGFPYHSRAARVGLALVKPASTEVPGAKVAEARLRDLGWPGLQLKKIEIKDGIRMSSGFETELVLGPKGDIRSFRARPGMANIDGATALAKGKKLILAQHPILPEGHFMVDPERSGYRRLVYRQRALGYDYLNWDAATVEYGANAAVATFQLRGPAQRATGMPPWIYSAADIEKIALKLAQPRVQRDTANVHYYATAKTKGTIGWWVDENGGHPTLCYMVDVWFMRDIKNWAVQGGGSTYPFDVSTGKCLRKFP